MGVPGLWDVIRPASQQRSLVHLSVHDGFLSTKHNKRGYRIGIDASIWFFHAHFAHGMHEGENPELRMLFFRLAKFLALPLLPLFVFDGPERPRYKRNKRVMGFQHPLTASFKEMIEAFGFEWHHAPGEAEAELAFLNRIEVIDAVLSDDVDNFLFGATLVMRNPSATLSGNRKHQLLNADGRQDDKQVLLFSAKDILKHPQIQLTHGGFILIGLMKGGDYDTGGLDRAGLKTSHGLARAGFGDTLLEVFHKHNQNPAQLSLALSAWRHNLREYLRKDPDKLIGKKMKALAASIPETFPPLQVLKDYAQPVTSEWREGARIPDFKWAKQPSLVAIANLCERHYEWGVKPLILKRFRTIIWDGALMRVLRASVMEGDRREMQRQRNRGIPQTPSNGRRTADFVVGTPSKLIARTLSRMQLQQPPHHPQRLGGREDVDPFADDYVPEEVEDGQKLLVKVHSKRVHASTDGVLEYRVEMNPVQFVRITEEGLLGLRREDLFDVDNFGRRRQPAAAAGNRDAPVRGGRAAADMDMDMNFDFGIGMGMGMDLDLDDEELAVRAAMRVSLADLGGAAVGGAGAGAGPGGRAPKEPAKPEDPMRIWVPACMLEMVEPGLVEEFEAKEDGKEQRKRDKEERARARAEGRELPKKSRVRGANANTGITRRGKGTSKSKDKANSALIPDAEDEEDEMDDDDDDNTDTETELEPTSPSKVKGKGKAVDRRKFTTTAKPMKSKSNSKPTATATSKGKGITKTTPMASPSALKPKPKPPPFDILEVLNNSDEDDEDDEDRGKDDDEDITDGIDPRYGHPPAAASRFPLDLNRAAPAHAIPVPTVTASYTTSRGVDKTRTQTRGGFIVELDDSDSDSGNESPTKQDVGRSGKTGKSAAISSSSLSSLSRTVSQSAQPSQRNRSTALAEPSSSSSKVIEATKVTNSRKATVPTSTSNRFSRIKKTTRSTTRETATNARRFLFSMPTDVREDGSVGTEGEERDEEQRQDADGEDDDVLDPYILLRPVRPAHSTHSSQVTCPSNPRTQSEPKKNSQTNRTKTTTRATYLSTNTRSKSGPSRIEFDMDLGDDSMAQDDADATVGPEDFTDMLAGIPDSPVKESYSPTKEPMELIPTKATSKAPTAQPKADKLFFSESSDESNNSDTGSEASDSLERIRQAAAKKKDKSKPPTIEPRLPPPTVTEKRGKASSGNTKGPRKSTRTAVKATSTSTSVSTKSAYLPTIATKKTVAYKATKGSTFRSTPVIDLSDSDDEESSPATRAPAKPNSKSSRSTKATSKSTTSTNATVATKSSRTPQVEVIDLLSD